MIEDELLRLKAMAVEMTDKALALQGMIRKRTARVNELEAENAQLRVENTRLQARINHCGGTCRVPNPSDK
jgi:regulator of replication initiation timing